MHVYVVREVEKGPKVPIFGRLITIAACPVSPPFPTQRVNKKTGKVEAEGADPNLLTKFKALLEPSVPLPVIINKGTIYVFLTIWAVIQASRGAGRRAPQAKETTHILHSHRNPTR